METDKKKKRPLCDEARLSVLVRAWQRAPRALQDEWWALFVTETADWLMAIIRSFKRDLSALGSHEDIRAELVLHLHNRVLPAFRSGRGRLFSLVTFSSHNYIRTLLDKQQRLAGHYAEMPTFLEVECCIVPPEVYGLPTEIRERLDHFTAPREDFQSFLVRNLVVDAMGLWGQRGTVPTIEQIARIVSEIVSLPEPHALEQTHTAVNALRKELADFRGRPSLYQGEVISEDVTEYSPNTLSELSNAFDYSCQ